MTRKHKPNKPFPSIKLILIRKFIKATEQGLELVPRDPELSRASTLFLPSIFLHSSFLGRVQGGSGIIHLLNRHSGDSWKTKYKDRYLLARLSLHPIMKCLHQGPLGLISILEDS